MTTDEISALSGVCGAALAAMSLVVAIASFLKPPPRRRVQFHLSRSFEFVSDAPAGDIAARQLGLPLSDELTIRIANTGRVSFPADAWGAPLQVVFAGGQIAAARLSGARPSHIEAQIEIAGSRVLVHPFLFNAGDLIQLHVRADSRKPPKVHARLQGVRRVSQKLYVYAPGTGPDGKMLKDDKFVAFVGFPVMFVFLGLLGFLKGTPEVQVFAPYAALTGVIATYGFLGWAVRNRRFWRVD